jgi:hypothetical protein
VIDKLSITDSRIIKVSESVVSILKHKILIIQNNADLTEIRLKAFDGGNTELLTIKNYSFKISKNEFFKIFVDFKVVEEVYLDNNDI